MVTWYWSLDRCQLIITLISNIKEVHSKPRLHVSVNPLFGVWPPYCATSPRRRRRVYAPTSNEKINSWVSFCFPYEYGAPLGDPSGRQSSAIICYASIPVTTCHCRKALKKIDEHPRDSLPGSKLLEINNKDKLRIVLCSVLLHHALHDIHLVLFFLRFRVMSLLCLEHR